MFNLYQLMYQVHFPLTVLWNSIMKPYILFANNNIPIISTKGGAAVKSLFSKEKMDFWAIGIFQVLTKTFKSIMKIDLQGCKFAYFLENIPMTSKRQIKRVSDHIIICCI